MFAVSGARGITPETTRKVQKIRLTKTMRHVLLTAVLPIFLPSSALAQGEIVNDIGRSWLGIDPVLGGAAFIFFGAAVWFANQWLKAQLALLAEKDAHRQSSERHAVALGDFKPIIAAHVASSEKLREVVQQLVDSQRFGRKG